MELSRRGFLQSCLAAAGVALTPALELPELEQPELLGIEQTDRRDAGGDWLWHLVICGESLRLINAQINRRIDYPWGALDLPVIPEIFRVDGWDLQATAIGAFLGGAHPVVPLKIELTYGDHSFSGEAVIDTCYITVRPRDLKFTDIELTGIGPLVYNTGG